jgi:hypothetical protein
LAERAFRAKPFQERVPKVTERSGEQLKVVVAAPADEAGVYSNVVQIRMTDFDLTLDFGQLTPPRNEEAVAAAVARGSVEVPAKVRVVIPVPVAISLTGALRDALSRYAKEKGLSLAAEPPPREGATE